MRGKIAQCWWWSGEAADSCSWLTEADAYHSLDMLRFSAHCHCKECLSELPQPPCQCSQAVLHGSQQGVSTHRDAAYWMFLDVVEKLVCINLKRPAITEIIKLLEPSHVHVKDHKDKVEISSATRFVWSKVIFSHKTCLYFGSICRRCVVFHFT